MKLSIQRDDVLQPLQLVSGAVERKQTLPILANVLLAVKGQVLSVVATDLEIELLGKVELPAAQEDIQLTVPARKFVDICRALPQNIELKLDFDPNARRLVIRAGRSRFTLSTLPASDFPNVEATHFDLAKFTVSRKELGEIFEKTYFAMAEQDVRYFLNGTLVELKQGVMRAVATDGHRLATTFTNSVQFIQAPAEDELQFIIPRKGVLELMKLLKDATAAEVTVAVGANHICVVADNFTFTSKLIEGQFPDYKVVIPTSGDKEILIKHTLLKQALTRVSILSNETYRGVRLYLAEGVFQLYANNPKQEEAEEELEVAYSGADFEFGMNVGYFLDVCNTISAGSAVRITFSHTAAGALVEEIGDENSQYVIMPMMV